MHGEIDRRTILYALRNFQVFHVIGGQDASDQIEVYAFQSFLVEAQTNADYIWAVHARI